MQVYPDRFYECAVCQDKVYFANLDEPCRYCGEESCYVKLFCQPEDAGPNDFDVVCEEYCGDSGPFHQLDEEGSEFICQHCFERFSYDADALVLAVPEGNEHNCEPGAYTYHYQGSIVIDPNYDELFELPSVYLNAIEGIVTGTHWKRTDAWRGYSNPPDKAGNWVLALDGWHSSMEQSELSELINNIANRGIELDYPVIIVFGKTSNVCSIGLSIFVLEKDVDRIKELFKDTEAAPRFAGF